MLITTLSDRADSSTRESIVDVTDVGELSSIARLKLYQPMNRSSFACLDAGKPRGILLGSSERLLQR